MIPKLRLQQGHADRNGYLMAFLLTTVIIGRLLVDCLFGKVLVPLIAIHTWYQVTCGGIKQIIDRAVQKASCRIRNEAGTITNCN